MSAEPIQGVPPTAPLPLPSWSGLVERIHAADASAMEELYAVFAKGVRYYLWRQLGPQDLDDRVHDIFLIITQAIQKGDLREPERLMGYVRTIARRQVAAQIDNAVRSRRHDVDVNNGIQLSDREPDPERRAIDKQNQEVAMRVLGSMNQRDREVLTRFYLLEHTPERICLEMKITATQFRLTKSRAKARYTELGQRRFAQRTGFRPPPLAI